MTSKNDTLRKYFPRSYTPKHMEETIIKLLEQWQKKRQHSEERLQDMNWKDPVGSFSLEKGENAYEK